MNLKISYKFDTPSVYKDEIYYFPQDKTELVMRSGAPKATIQAIFCCHSGKWRADTFYIEPELYIDLLIYFGNNTDKL